MTLLYDYVWYALGAAGFVGFLLAWIVRGAMVSGRKRRATVERDVALTELEQVRAELDSLYAAQRKQKEAASVAPANMDTEIRERDDRLARMTSDLEATRSELEALRLSREAVETPDTVMDEDAVADLQSRNAWLEERVGELENMVHDSAAAGPDEPAHVNADDADGPEEDKLEWQVDYLKTRIAALEEELLAAESKPVETSPPVAANPAADEELARLRWRNRYLEGRLAYFEEGREAEDETIAATQTGPVEVVMDENVDVDVDEDEPVADPSDVEGTAEEAVEEDLASEAENISVDEQAETEPAPTLEDAEVDSEVIADEPLEPEPEPEPEPAAENADDHPAEKMLRALGAEEAMEDGEDEEADEVDAYDPDEETSSETALDDAVEVDPGEAPPGLEKPDGEPDDLTLIMGIGPRIQSILNDLGIWHFSQIAEWTADNEVWIDNQLNFAGRVNREGWVSQAKEFVDANAAAPAER